MPRMHYTYTRSGLAPTIIPDRVPTEADRLRALTTWWAPVKGYHYSGKTYFRFGCRFAWQQYLNRTADR